LGKTPTTTNGKSKPNNNEQHQNNEPHTGREFIEEIRIKNSEKSLSAVGWEKVLSLDNKIGLKEK